MSPDSEPYVDLSGAPLTPGDAVAAIILVGECYLLQHRDAKEGIFFPDCWGCFGGGVDPGESSDQALVRELAEELGFARQTAACNFFTRFDFDFSFAPGCPSIYRLYYELRLPVSAYAGFRLGEGQGLGLFTANEILAAQPRLTPYDAFALWMHASRSRFVPAQ